MASVDLAVVSKRKNEIRDKVRRSSPALIYSSKDGIHIIAPHRSSRRDRSRVYRILDRIAFIPRGTANGCRAIGGHAVIEGERKGLETSRGYVFSEQISESIGHVLAVTYNNYWERPFPMEGVVCKVGSTIEDDELFFIDVAGDYRPIENVHFLGSCDKSGGNQTKEDEQLERVHTDFLACWDPDAGYERILELFSGLPTVQDNEELRNAFDAPRVEHVLLDRSRVQQKNWRGTFRRMT